MQTFKVPKTATLLEVLANLFPDSSRSTLRSWVQHKRILIDNSVAKTCSQLIAENATLCLLPKPLPQEGPLTIHFEDPHLIVVEKPAGICSVATNDPKEISVHTLIKQRYPWKKVYVIHRLDKETSGLMVFALTQHSFGFLKKQLQERYIRRIYRAVVEGSIVQDGSWKTFLIEDRFLKMHVVPKDTPHAEYAVTHYQVLQSTSKFTLLDCHLETGKKNQIRVQASYFGHPIVGDSKYGSSLKKELCLHARLLAFCHPVTKESLVFECPPPKFYDNYFQK